MNNASLPLGVCVFPRVAENRARGVAYPNYIHEILAHAGVAYSSVDFEELELCLPQLRILVTVGEAEVPESLQQRLRDWVGQGGAWLSIAGLCGMNELFGADYILPEYAGVWGGAPYVTTLGEGYLQPTDTAHPILAHLTIPLHFFNGLPVQISTENSDANMLAQIVDAHQRPTSRCAIIERRVGQGSTLFIAPDVTGTVVRIQQGVAVTRDGVPASDGTGPVTDGVLTADDGAVLDWDFDRQDVPDVPGLKGFLQPIADQWRELLLRSIFHLATEHSVMLPVLWLYPRNLPALAHISHDSDGNDPVAARRLLEVVQEAQINTTWCIIEPGYDESLIAAIRAAGHELAMHFDAMSEGCPWGEEYFEAQWQFLQKQFGEQPVSNKNHYTRWEGDTEFFEWCQKRNIQLDQSKGTSKSGEVGFNFGTCHLYFPVAPGGSLIDVLEHPTMTQDLEVFVPAAAVKIILDGALRHHGVAHVLFHPAHVVREEVAAALLSTVAAARAQGMEWWTARQLNEWERARRGVRWRHASSGGGVSLTAEKPLREATLLFLNDCHNPFINDRQYSMQTVTRWGFEFQTVTLDLEESNSYVLQHRMNGAVEE